MDLFQLRKRVTQENGVTLVELVAVMAIIIILTLVAIPFFSNQQGKATDAKTLEDVRSVAVNVHSALTRYPDATYYDVQANANGVEIRVGDSSTEYISYDVPLTPGTEVEVVADTVNGTFIVRGWDPSGTSYKTSGTAAEWSSVSGGFDA